MKNIVLEQRPRDSAGRKSQCTRLFALTPCGLNTGLIESLPSYLDRLAQLHAVRNGPFFLNEIHGEPVPSSGSLLARHSRGLLLGNGNAHRIALAVAKLTGLPEVVNLVQPYVSLHVSWYKNTRPKAAWCPICFSEWPEKDLPVYRPLLWSFGAVRCCPIHNVTLQERCPNCSREFDHFGPHRWSSFCPTCGHALFERLDAATNETERVSLYDSYCSWRISDFLNWGLRCSADDIPSNRFFVNIRNAIAEVRSEYRLASLTGLSRAVIQKWRHGRGRPLLPALLRLSYCFDIGLADWVSTLIPRDLFNRTTAVPRGVAIFQTYTRQPTSKSIRQSVIAHLAESTKNPPSVRELAIKIGAHSRKLYKVCPGLIRQVVARRARALRRRKERSEAERVRMVHQAIAEIQATGARASRNAVLALLNSRGVKCSWLLKEIFRKEITHHRE